MCKFVGLNVNRIEKGNKYDSRCESNNSNLGKDWDFSLSSLVPPRSVVTLPSNSTLVFCAIIFLMVECLWLLARRRFRKFLLANEMQTYICYWSLCSLSN